MPTASVRFFYQGHSFPFRNRQAVKRMVARLFKEEKTSLQQVRIIFCSDEQLLQMNRDFLQHDYYTDIITFPLSAVGAPVEAELYISTDRVKDNAASMQTAFSRELHRVIFHGCLHLCGYKDKSSQQIKVMREREDYYLRLYLHK